MKGGLDAAEQLLQLFPLNASDGKNTGLLYLNQIDSLAILLCGQRNAHFHFIFICIANFACLIVQLQVGGRIPLTCKHIRAVAKYVYLKK